MEEQNQGGLEAVVSEKPVQKRQGMKKFLIYAGQLPKFIITGIAGIGLATSLYFGAISSYKAVEEFIAVEPNEVEAAKSSDEPSPYEGCICYCLILGMCALSGAAFGYATIASVKEAKENIEEEMKKQ